MFLLCALWGCSAFSQTNFEKGYFIDNTGKRNECLIRNVDWKNNPQNFQYKASEDAEVRSTGIGQVREFGIDGKTKYQRHTVMLDTSSDLTSELSFQRVPTFTDETLFLNVLVEGKASLFQYEKGNSRRFFYSMEDQGTEVRPLIYKRYKSSNRGTGTNNQFRDQLANQLDCPEISQASISRMEYKPDPLVRLFQEINACKGGEALTYETGASKLKFHLAARIGFNHASAYVEQKPPLPETRRIIVDYEGKVYPRFGLELELVLPFRRNNWSLFLDPSFQAFEAEKQFIQRIAIYDVETTSRINYKTIEIPFGIRHYIYLSDKSQLFLNASIALVFNSDSKIEFETESALGDEDDIIIDGTEEYFSLGFGYRFNNRWSLEARYNTNRDLLAEIPNWTSTFDKSFSVILGYNFL